MSSDFVNAIEELGKEKGIEPEVLFKAVEDALVVAYKKNFDSTQTVRVELDRKNGDFHVFEKRTVVETPTNPHEEIALAEAQKLNPDYQLEDIIEQEVYPKDFSRIAVQNAKQIIMQRIRESLQLVEKRLIPSACHHHDCPVLDLSGKRLRPRLVRASAVRLRLISRTLRKRLAVSSPR